MTGIEERHSLHCPTREGGSCSKGRRGGCVPTYRAVVYDRLRKKKTSTATTTDLAEAKRRRAELLAGLGQGRATPSATMKVSEAVEIWLTGIEGDPPTILTRSKEPYKPSTVRGLRRDFERYLLPQFGARKVGDLQRGHVQALIDELVGQGLSAGKVRNVGVSLKTFIRWAIQRELIWNDPTALVDLPISRGRRERAAEVPEARELIDALDPQDRPIWATAMYGGLRRGELRALRARDVDLGAGVIRVERSWDDVEGEIAPKSRKGTRRVPIVPLLRDFLDQHLLATGRSGDDLIFGSSPTQPFTATNIGRKAKRAWRDENAKRAEEERPLLKPITLHECRHSYVTLMAQAGFSLVEIGDFVGHGSAWMTDHYRHLLEGSEAAAAERFGEYLERADSGGRIAQLDRIAA
jgi:integrase